MSRTASALKEKSFSSVKYVAVGKLLVRHARQRTGCRLAEAQQHVLVSHDLRAFECPRGAERRARGGDRGVSADVVAVQVCVDDVPDRAIGETANRRQDLRAHLLGP